MKKRSSNKGSEPRPDATQAEAPTLEQMKSPVWRICNIYTIKNDKGKREKFVPNKEQREVLRAIFIDKKMKIFIPKARQLGMSTLVAIIILDSLLFGSGVQCSICDFVGANARKKLEGKIVYAFENLPDEWKKGWEVVVHNRNSGEWRIKRSGAERHEESVVFAGDKPRGDTYQIVHLSELGETQVKAPERAKEIFEGSLPTAEESLIVIETTWPGGKTGLLYGLVKEAMETPDHLKDLKKDYFILFFPWFYQKKYTNSGSAEQITDATRRYFAKLQEEVKDHTFTEGQMLWYQKVKGRLLNRIYSVYPSRLSEIFLAPVEGSIYAAAIDEARSEGRIGGELYDPSIAVDTLWDFGAPTNTIVWYFQKKGDKIVFIDVDVTEGEAGEISGLDITLPTRAKHMMGKGYKFGTHYMPHDAVHRDTKHRTSWMGDLRDAGLSGKFTVLPRCEEIWSGINKSVEMFGSFWFDSKTALGIDGLAAFRRRPDPSNDKQFLNEVIHDFASHIADPIRYLAEANISGYLAKSEDHMSTRLAFHPEAIASIYSKSANNKAIRAVLEMERNAPMTRSETGWLRIWKRPNEALPHLVVLHKDVIQVWSGVNHQSKTPALVASSINEGRVDRDIAIQRAILASQHYGNCIVVPTINESDGVIEKLSMEDCYIYKRAVSDAKRPSGRQSPARKAGYDLNPVIRTGIIEDLIAVARDNLVWIADEELAEQAGVFIKFDDGSFGPQQGYEDTKIEAAAIAFACIGSATDSYLSGGDGVDEME